MGKWQYNVELPVERTGKKEFSLGEKGVLFCPTCQSIYYKKFWHHSSPSQGKVEGKSILCPACRMIKDKEFEGQLAINNFPVNSKEDLAKLIKNFCQRAFERNPMDRLIDIKNDSGNLIITTTENQLAVKLAKKIKEVFNKYKIQMKISYSPEPSDMAYIKMNFAK